MADEGESDGRSVLTPSRERLSTRLWLSLISCRQVKKVGRRSAPALRRGLIRRRSVNLLRLVRIWGARSSRRELVFALLLQTLNLLAIAINLRLIAIELLLLAIVGVFLPLQLIADQCARA